MARIFITGIRGYLGGCVAAVLGKAGHQVMACDCRLAELAPGTVEADTAIHLAALLPARAAETVPADALESDNAAMTRHLIAALKPGTAVIYLSSRAVYGQRDGAKVCEAVLPQPDTPYGHGKLAGEEAVADSGHPHLLLRTSVLFGHGVRDDGLSFVTRMADDAISTGRITIAGGEQKVDPLYVWDLARLVRLLCERGAWRNEVLNVSGRHDRVRDWAGAIAEAVCARGLPCEVHVAGSKPPSGVLLDSRRIDSLVSRKHWSTDRDLALAPLIRARLTRLN